MKIPWQDRQKLIKHSAVSSDGGFLETTVTGVTNLSTGSIVYGNASEIVTELAIGATTGDVLTISGSSLPAWEGSAVAGGNLELIETKTATGSATSFDFTFASALNFATDTSAMFFVIQGGTDAGTDVRARVGDETNGSVYSDSTYDLTTTLNTAGTVTGTSTTAQTYWEVLPSMGGWNRIAMIGYITGSINNDGDTNLSLTLSSNAVLYTSSMMGDNTTLTDGTLKYFNAYVGSSYFENDSSCTCYKVKRA